MARPEGADRGRGHAPAVVAIQANTSTQEVANEVRRAERTPGLKQIVLDVDSPGSGFAGIPELVDHDPWGGQIAPDDFATGYDASSHLVLAGKQYFTRREPGITQSQRRRPVREPVPSCTGIWCVRMDVSVCI